MVRDFELHAKTMRNVVHAGVWEAITDVMSIVKIGGKPLLRKRRRSTDAKPGLAGAALERRIDALARNPLYAKNIPAPRSN